MGPTGVGKHLRQVGAGISTAVFDSGDESRSRSAVARESRFN
jgi:hypothetical protein